MYFNDRVQAGKMLATQMAQELANSNASIVALSESSLVVAEQIANELHGILLLLNIQDIRLPGESIPFIGMSQGGSMTFNTGAFTSSQINDWTGEYNGFIQGDRVRKFHEINRAGFDTYISPKSINGHTIILVADGLDSPFDLDIAYDFLKPYPVKALIIATPLASVKAIDRMHLVADKIFCLSVVQNYLATDHYYENNEIPTHDELVGVMDKINASWKEPISTSQTK